MLSTGLALDEPTDHPIASHLDRFSLYCGSRSDSPILLYGKVRFCCLTVARTIHQSSLQSEKPFVMVRCGISRGDRTERCFFGSSDSHRRAYIRRPGRQQGCIAQAEGGTLYVEQITYATPLMQDRLLQILKEGAYVDPVTGETHRANFRLIATMACSIDTALKQKTLTPGLAARLSQVILSVPTYGFGLLRGRPVREAPEVDPADMFAQETAPAVA